MLICYWCRWPILLGVYTRIGGLQVRSEVLLHHVLYVRVMHLSTTHLFFKFYYFFLRPALMAHPSTTLYSMLRCSIKKGLPNSYTHRATKTENLRIRRE